MKIREPIIATPSFVLKIFPWSESVDLIKHNLNVLWHRNGSNQIIILMNQHEPVSKGYQIFFFPRLCQIILGHLEAIQY